MLPLTEGSLRLRVDDEDSLTSEDSFFSATEVTGRGDGCRGREWSEGQAPGDPLTLLVSTGLWEREGISSDGSRIWQSPNAAPPGTQCNCWGQRGLRSQGL